MTDRFDEMAQSIVGDYGHQHLNSWRSDKDCRECKLRDQIAAALRKVHQESERWRAEMMIANERLTSDLAEAHRQLALLRAVAEAADGNGLQTYKTYGLLNALKAAREGGAL